MTVSDLLHRGKANAVPGRDLVRLLGLHDLRELTQMMLTSMRFPLPAYLRGRESVRRSCLVGNAFPLLTMTIIALIK